MRPYKAITRAHVCRCDAWHARARPFVFWRPLAVAAKMVHACIHHSWRQARARQSHTCDQASKCRELMPLAASWAKARHADRPGIIRRSRQQHQATGRRISSCTCLVRATTPAAYASRSMYLCFQCRANSKSRCALESCAHESRYTTSQNKYPILTLPSSPLSTLTTPLTPRLKGLCPQRRFVENKPSCDEANDMRLDKKMTTPRTREPSAENMFCGTHQCETRPHLRL